MYSMAVQKAGEKAGRFRHGGQAEHTEKKWHGSMRVVQPLAGKLGWRGGQMQTPKEIN